jgi:hypothetical protein
VVTEGGDRCVAYFQVLTNCIVSGDVCLNFVAQALVERALPGNRCLARSFSATTRLFERPPAARLKTAHLRRELSLAQLAPGAPLKFGDIRSPFTSVSLALGPNIPF